MTEKKICNACDTFQKRINMVSNFQTAFGSPVAPTPTIPNLSRCELRQSLLVEEVDELEAAWRDSNLVEVADALGDILYIVYGTALEFGLANKLGEVFDEIHRSNMSKLDENGNPIFRADGKILKGINYSKPSLEKIIYGKFETSGML